MNSKISHPAFAPALPERTHVEWIYKRIFDIGLCSFAIIFLLPLLILLSFIVLLTQGRPIIYRHSRLGLEGKTFSCLKFRTMVANADKVLQDHLASNPQAALQWQQQQKLMHDPRITPLGMFLRRSSLDELPQLYNILTGDMSFVGPRPIVPDEAVRYGDRAVLLMSVRPGLTGLWQVSGRSNLSYETRVSLDMEYIETRTLLGDIKIIARTVPAILAQRGSV